jgi:hypothetical protein
MSIEAAMGEPGISHQAGDAGPFDALGAELCPRNVEDAFAGLVLVTLLVTHG